MKKLLLPIAAVVMTTCTISCKKTAQETSQNDISQETLAKINSLGFGTSTVQKHEDGYLVEGDIILTEELLNSTPSNLLLRIGEVEQYRTTNLVKVGGTRTITVSLSSRLPSSYLAALEEAVSRYNAENLTIELLIVTGNADISVV